MTEEEAKRFGELENKAVSYYLDKTDFDVSEWLEPAEAEEYRVLLYKDLGEPTTTE